MPDKTNQPRLDDPLQAREKLIEHLKPIYDLSKPKSCLPPDEDALFWLAMKTEGEDECRRIIERNGFEWQTDLPPGRESPLTEPE